MNYLLILLIGIPFFSSLILFFSNKKINKISGIISVIITSITFVLSVYIYISVQNTGSLLLNIPWIDLKNYNIDFNLLCDRLSALMLLIISGISFMTQIYSMGYMKGNARISKYFAYLLFFTASMFGLVLSKSLVLLFMFWEFVGLASYLLIGFYYDTKKAALAQKKAFLFTKFADLGLLCAIILMISNNISLENFSLINSSLLTFVSLLIFIGAIGKSAQFPFMMWLPSAMAGPTPVSALIHSATMVVSGVYLTARFLPLFTSTSLLVVLIIGCITALIGGITALTQKEIKKVLASSTISQLGYMFVSLGALGSSAAIFHLETHAIFKSMLFLCAGSIIYASNGINDIDKIGFSRKNLKITYFALLIGSLALSGIPPFNGFFSKEEIYASLFETNKIAFIILLVSSFITAFYIFRLFFKLTSNSVKTKIIKPTLSMDFPLIILSALTLITGILQPKFLHIENEMNSAITIIAILTPIIGILFAYILYYNRDKKAKKRNFIIFKITYNYFYLNKIISALTKTPLNALSRAAYFIDKNIIDLFVNKIGILTLSSGKISHIADSSFIDKGIDKTALNLKKIGRLFTKIQTGNVQTYIFVFLIAISILFIFLEIY